MTAKQAARDLIERLPDGVNWEEILYELYVRQKIEEGLADLEAGRAVPHDEARRQLLGNWQA